MIGLIAVTHNSYTTLLWITMKVPLFRAVSEDEREDIQFFQGFRPHPRGRSYLSKLFARSAADAARFGRDNFRFDDKPFHLMQVEVPETLAETFECLYLDRKRAVNVPQQQLPQLNRKAVIQELSWIPLN